MRNIVEKRKLITDYPYFNAFKENLSLDGTYSVNEEILDRSFRNLPFHMRDADLTMIAGAYKTGSIAMMDKVGNIVDLGFSRTGSAYGFVNGMANIYTADTPVLDEFHYKTNVLGYLIEDVKDYYIRSGNNSRTITSVANVDIDNSGSVDFHNPIKILERDDVSAVSHNFNVQVRYGQEESSLVGYQSIIRLSEFLNFDNSTANSSSLGRTIYNYHGFTFNKGLPPIRNGYGQTVGMINHPNRYLNFDFNEAWSAFRPTLNTVNEVSQHNLGGYVGQLGKYASIMPFYNNISAPATRAIADIINEVPLKFASSSTYLGSDIIAPITLTNDAIIHIKTAKGIQEFTLSAGGFNINDYVVNDKLICFAIKYLPNIEDFINNLTLDGTYTFDDDVIRDSYTDLINRISTNSTLLHQFLNSNHIVLPYAYRTGYVAAMNLEDGSIVELEFERASNGYGYLNGDIIEYSSHSIISDLFHYKSDEIGFVFEGERPMLLAYPYSSLSSSIAGNAILNATITNMSSYNWAGVGKVRPNAFTNNYARFNLNSMRNGWTKFRLFVKRYGAKDYDLAYQTSNNAFNHAITFNLTANVATINSPSAVRNAIIYDYEGYKVIEFESSHVTGSGRFFFRYNNANYFDSDRLSGIEIGWLNVALSDTEFNSYIHYQGTNYTKNKDHLKTESYSKVITVGVQTGIKVGSYTDPQSIVQNDKVNFILLKQ